VPPANPIPNQADAILEKLGHETVDAASNGSPLHENAGGLVACGQGALHGRELPAKAPNAESKFCFFARGFSKSAIYISVAGRLFHSQQQIHL
jgi:hypothetical protein